MERFDEEYWRITVKPISSGQFRYKFTVDGVQTPDTVNSLTIGSVRIARSDWGGEVWVINYV